MTDKYILELTRAQHMALLDLIIECIREQKPTLYYDYSTDPPTETRPSELMRAVTEATFIEIKIGEKLCLVRKTKT